MGIPDIEYPFRKLKLKLTFGEARSGKSFLTSSFDISQVICLCHSDIQRLDHICYTKDEKH